MFRRSVRLQLTQWYALAMLAGLCLFGTASFFALRHAITASKKDTLLHREQRVFTYFHELEVNEDPRSWVLQLRDYADAAPEGNLIQIYDHAGTRLFPQYNVRAVDIAWPSDRSCATPCFGEAIVDGRRLLTMRHDVLISTKPTRLCMAGSLVEHFDILQHFRTAMLWYLPLVVIVSVLGGYMLSARALKPVDHMTRMAIGIGITNLSKRIPVEDSGDEIQRLAEAWNDLLERLESSVTRQQQFTSDASHDLRTSIAVILGTGQLTLRHQRTEEEYREAIATMVSECDSTSHLLEDLLLLARGDVFTTTVGHMPVNITQLIKDVSQRVLGLVSAKAQRIEVYTASDPILVLGDRKLLQRLLSILIDNAVKYTPAGGAIRISLERQDDDFVHLSVRDTGIGIPSEQLSRIFDRFYRADSARSRNSGGFGLGLAIAKWISVSHSAEISVTSALNEGSTFVVRFPECRIDTSRSVSEQARLEWTRG
jgi:two-component system, OmpR family, heavy metal sensor histidine kinase CusS